MLRVSNSSPLCSRVSSSSGSFLGWVLSTCPTGPASTFSPALCSRRLNRLITGLYSHSPQVLWLPAQLGQRGCPQNCGRGEQRHGCLLLWLLPARLGSRWRLPSHMAMASFRGPGALHPCYPHSPALTSSHSPHRALLRLSLGRASLPSLPPHLWMTWLGTPP